MQVRVLKKGLTEKGTLVQRLDRGEGRRSGGQLLQAEGTVRAKPLRQECARRDREEQGGMVGAEGTRGTGMAADALRKITGAGSQRVLQTKLMTLAFTL